MRFCAPLSTVGDQQSTFPISFSYVSLRKRRTFILITPSLSFHFLSLSLSLLLSNSSGGTTYIIEGKELSIARIRHLVFYLIPVTQEDTPNMADNQNDPTESPPEGPPDNSEGPKFSVPSPLLITDPFTMCAETWDYKSEVSVICMTSSKLLYDIIGNNTYTATY